MTTATIFNMPSSMYPRSSVVLFAAVFLQALYYIAHGQIPRLCASNFTEGRKTCCPAMPGEYEVCGGWKRGECRRIKVYHEVVNPVYFMDDRYEWPLRFFEFTCHCRDNYFGTACEECKPGWVGVNCDIAKMFVRRNVMSYSSEERRILREIMAMSHEVESPNMLIYESDNVHSDPAYKPTLIKTSVHEFQAALHRYASRATLFSDPLLCLEYGSLDYNHGVTSFSIWHRYFTMEWEKELRKIAWREFGIKDFTAPYWDWIDNTYCEACVDSLMGAGGPILPDGRQLLSNKSPFANFSEYCQSPPGKSKCVGCHFVSNYRKLNRHWDETYFPTSSELEYIMKKERFYVPHEQANQCDSFHKSFEGFCGPDSPGSKFTWMHNRVHNMVTGSFCCAATAANDPLFILHHSQVDRILQAWFSMHRPGVDQLPTYGVKPGQTRESNMVGFYPTIRNMDVFKDSRELGYTYDNFKFGKQGLSYDKYQ